MNYRRVSSPLHAARAAAGGAYCLALAGVAMATEHPLVLGAVAVAVAGAGIAAGVRRELISAARFSIPLALLLIAVNVLVVRQGLTVFARLGELPPLGQVDLTVEALVYGALLGARVMIVICASALFTAAVDPDEILALFRRVSFRSALTAALATRMVPVLARDARRLRDARRCRPDGGGSGASVNAAVMRALASGALDRAIDVAATLEVRGYGAAGRTPARARMPWSRHDLAFAASAVALVALAIAARAGGLAGVREYPALVVAVGAAEAALALAIVLVALLPFADRRGIER